MMFKRESKRTFRFAEKCFSFENLQTFRFADYNKSSIVEPVTLSLFPTAS